MRAAKIRKFNQSGTLFKQPEPHKLYLPIYEQLKKEIILEEIMAGGPVNEIDMAERFKTSRAPIREACMHLHKHGFLSSTPYKGYTVTEVSMEEIRQLYQVRLVIECAAVEMAAQNPYVPEKAFDEIELNLEIQRTAPLPEDLFRHLTAESEFHIGLAKASGNELFAKFVEETMERFQRFHVRVLRMSPEKRIDTQVVADWHSTIVRAVRNRDPELARKSMYQHIVDAREISLRRYFQ